MAVCHRLCLALAQGALRILVVQLATVPNIAQAPGAHAIPLVVAEGHTVGAHRLCLLWVSLTSNVMEHHRPQLPDHQLRPPPPWLSHEPPVGSLTTVAPLPATSSGSHGARLICRRAGCQEPVHPECTTSYCNIHCRSHRCTFHHYSPGQGATSVLTRTS